MHPQVNGFFDKETWTLTYVVHDPVSKDAVIIDSVLDYDVAASKTATHSNTRIRDYIAAQDLKVHLILETHAHADHLSGSQDLKRHFPAARIGIGANITAVQQVFKEIFNFDESFRTDGSQFDLLLADNSVTRAGTLEIRTLFTPGHTPACASYLIGDAVFTGDALFMPDYGTGRCDFPAGSASALYDSVHGRLYALPVTTRVFVGHDYQPNGRALAFESTIGDEKAHNIQLRGETTREEFIAFRSARDQTLSVPKLLLPSVQINIMAGHLPPPARNGKRYLHIPIE